MSTDDIEFYVNGIAATTDPVVINGKKIKLSLEGIEKMAREAPGTPLLYEHKGRPIGRVIDAWVEGNKLHYRAGLFKPKDSWTREGIARIKSGELKGVSVSFSYSEDEETD